MTIICSRVVMLRVLGGIVLFSITLSARADVECQRETISFAVSPDDEWTALVQEDVCASEGFGTTGVTDTVQIVRRGINPTEENDVFALDEHGRPENRPAIRWLSSKILQITVPNKSLIALQEKHYKDIDVDVKFEPDNPEERERFLRRLGLSRE